MRLFRPAIALCLLLPLVPAGGAALAQTTTSPPPGNLALPTPHQGSSLGAAKQAATPAPPKPTEPVKTPVVQPHGQTHAQPAKPVAPKPGHHPAKPPAAKPPAAKPAPPAAPPPAPAPEAAPPAPPAEPTKGTATGNPLPRFASLRTDEVNLRRGPGTRYPIDWVYKRRDLPVEIEREFEVWRLIVDPDGVKGWVHQATLTGRRSFIVTGAERTLRREASDTSAAVALLKPGVIGRIRSCEAASNWCQMQVGDYRGYLKRDEFWGALPGEAIAN